MPIMFGICAGIALDKLMPCVIAGFLFVKVYKQLRDGKPDGFFFHWLYWKGFGFGKGYTLVNPFARFWVN